MKKILFLGGAVTQLPAIKYIKEQGHYLIICDYLKDNPGIEYADEYYCLSIIDKEAILELAKELKIDGIISYASCAAAPTVAYVSEKLDLPGNPYESVNIVSNKQLYRKFLIDHGFNAPKYVYGKSYADIEKGLDALTFPLIVKPVDSSGSRGITRVNQLEDLRAAVDYALKESRGKTIIVEDFIIRDYHSYMVSEVVVRDSEVMFVEVMDSIRQDKIQGTIPIGTLYPCTLEEEKLLVVKNEIRRLLRCLNMKVGDFTVEILIDRNGKVYFFDMGARNPGHMVPQFLENATGVKLVKNIVESSIGNDNVNLKVDYDGSCYFKYFLFSSDSGILEDIVYSEEIMSNFEKVIMYKEKGSQVEVMTGGDKLIGIVFLKFDSLEEYKQKFQNIDQYIQVKVNSEKNQAVTV